MKACLYCGQLSDYAAYSCWRCGRALFVPMGMLLPDSPIHIPEPVSAPGPMTIEPEGDLTLLKCRSPGEAYLIAQQLEAADILVTLPEAKVITQEFHSKGFVSLRVSTRAYEAATEVQRRIDRRRWESELSFRPPSPMMNLVAAGLGFINILGLPIFLLLHGIYIEKSYARRAKGFAYWFGIGVGMFVVWLAAQWLRFRS
jgi:hypothetical protein